MIVCSCNFITDRDIRDAVDGLMLAGPVQNLTPCKVYKAIGSRPNCGSCLNNASELIRKRAAHLHSYVGHDCKEVMNTSPTQDDAAEGSGEVVELTF